MCVRPFVLLGRNSVHVQKKKRRKVPSSTASGCISISWHIVTLMCVVHYIQWYGCIHQQFILNLKLICNHTADTMNLFHPLCCLFHWCFFLFPSQSKRQSYIFMSYVILLLFCNAISSRFFLFLLFFAGKRQCLMERKMFDRMWEIVDATKCFADIMQGVIYE